MVFAHETSNLSYLVLRCRGEGHGTAHRCKLKALTNRIRGYTGQVRLRGLIKNQGFETHAGGFCLCRRGF
ncbi:MAG TPA: hypothetical protein VK203_09075 [Nostocaceae cyanobacterium]|nr:hypothetical protein [Nostocaceae cyanobacterium]